MIIILIWFFLPHLHSRLRDGLDFEPLGGRGVGHLLVGERLEDGGLAGVVQAEQNHLHLAVGLQLLQGRKQPHFLGTDNRRRI